MDKAHCVTLGVGEGGFQPSPCGPVSRRAVADFCFLPALCSSGDSGLSLSAPRLPPLTWPGLEELPVRAGCDDLPTAIVKSRVHWERTPCPALPCPALPCPALPCLALPCPALPCPALPCPALPAFRLDYPAPGCCGTAPPPLCLGGGHQPLESFLTPGCSEGSLFHSRLPFASLPISLLYWLLTSALVK